MKVSKRFKYFLLVISAVPISWLIISSIFSFIGSVALFQLTLLFTRMQNTTALLNAGFQLLGYSLIAAAPLGAMVWWISKNKLLSLLIWIGTGCISVLLYFVVIISFIVVSLNPVK